MTPFHADTAVAERAEDAEIPVLRARLSQSSADHSLYLQFERQTEPTEQAVGVGFHRPHIEICDQGFSGYNLVEKVSLAPGTLTVFFNEKGKRVLRSSGTYTVTLDPGLDLRCFAEVLREISPG